MKLLLGSDVAGRLRTAILRAGQREIGGILMGEHVGEDEFRVVDATVQVRGGTFATFVRAVEAFAAPLRQFFERTRHDYRRFNYLGEWHSHHSFALVPSHKDERTMRDIVDDPEVGARFAVLLLLRVNGDCLEGSVTVYLPGGERGVGRLVLDRERPV